MVLSGSSSIARPNRIKSTQIREKQTNQCKCIYVADDYMQNQEISIRLSNRPHGMEEMKDAYAICLTHYVLNYLKLYTYRSRSCRRGGEIAHPAPPTYHLWRSPPCIRFRNSIRVLLSLRKAPSMELVTISESLFLTPLIAIQRWTASIVTATPRGLR